MIRSRPSHNCLFLRVGSGILLLTALGCDPATAPQTHPPARLAIVSGDDQAGSVGTALGQQLVVMVTDAGGRGVPNINVSWSTSAGRGSVNPSTSATDARGQAATNWTLGTLAGVDSVTATVAGVGNRILTARVQAGPAATLKLSPDSISLDRPGDTLRLTAEAADQFGNPVTPGTLTWTVSDTSVAEISPAGIVRAKRTGATAISASFNNLRTSAKVVVLGPYTFITAGYTHTCAIVASGRAYCWGENATGNLGNGTTTSSSVPAAVAGNLRFVTLAAGIQITCGIANDEATYCWGSNGVGTLGNGTTNDSHMPTPTSGSLKFKQISLGPGAGSSHVCALTAAGEAYCWGNNFSGMIGDGSTENRLAPTRVSGSLAFSSISAGDNHSCALTAAGAAYCWGSNSDGQLAQADGGQTCGDAFVNWNCSTVPVVVGGGLIFSSIEAGGSYTCGITTVGEAYCWGKGRDGELGHGQFAGSFSPVQVSGSLSFAFLAAGYPGQTCGITTSGDTYCWGGNLTGELGNGTTSPSNVPTRISGDIKLTSIKAGGQFNCGLTPLREAYCWGANSSGSLGDGTSENRHIPTQVRQPVGW